MKTLNTIVKILAALAAVAGAVYVVATYGEQDIALSHGVLLATGNDNCFHLFHLLYIV